MPRTWGGLIDHAKKAGQQRRDLAERAQGFQEQQHQDTHGLARDKFGAQQEQFGQTHQLARDNLNQAGSQFDATHELDKGRFQYGQQRDQLGDERYRNEAADARARLAIDDQRYEDAWQMEKGKAAMPGFQQMFDPDTGQRTTQTTPGLHRQDDGSFKPGESPEMQKLLEQLEIYRRQLGISQ